MDRFLTRYVLPPLARTVQLEALWANQRALLLLRQGGDDPDLGRVLAVGAGCWWLLRPALTSARWRAVRDCLARQRTLLQRRPVRRGKLARTLERQSAWLGELASAPVPADPVVLDRIARAYRKAWREARRNPASERMGRRLRRLVLCEELLLSGPGPKTRSGMAGEEARSRLLALVWPDAAGPSATDRPVGGAAGSHRRVASGRRKREIRRLASRAFEVPPATYRADLPGAVRRLHWPQPRPLVAGQGGESCEWREWP